MRRKKQLLMAMLCTFSMLINSAAAVAQSKDKQRKSGAQKTPEVLNDVLVPNDVILFGELAQDPVFEIAVADSDQKDVIYTPAAQVEWVHNEFSFDGKVVKGAPYSADAVTETIQTLGDGNRIVRNSSAKIYRDGAGRTRREQALKAVGPWSVSGDAPVMISINDAVSGVHYSLDPNTRTAHKMTAPRMGNLSGDTKATVELRAAEARGTARLKARNSAGAEVATGGVTNVVTSVGAGTFTSSISMSAGERVDAEVNRESLGAQTIEGVQAEGARVTFTIPAGKIGNERPIVTVNERWYSAELQTVVMSKNSDPRMGETTYRLTNIARSEPDPSLFQIPADYTVKEGGFGFGFGGGRPAEMLKRLEVEKKAGKPNDN